MKKTELEQMQEHAHNMADVLFKGMLNHQIGGEVSLMAKQRAKKSAMVAVNICLENAKITDKLINTITQRIEHVADLRDIKAIIPKATAVEFWEAVKKSLNVK